MVRIILTYALPLLLPTVLYFIWTSWVKTQIEKNRAKAKAEGQDPEDGDHTHVEDFDIKTPWFRLILAGAVLMVVGLIISIVFSTTNPPESVYQAPYQRDDGSIAPGQFMPKPKE